MAQKKICEYLNCKTCIFKGTGDCFGRNPQFKDSYFKTELAKKVNEILTSNMGEIIK